MPVPAAESLTVAAHTPGPWQSNGSHIYAPDGAMIAQVHNPGSRESDYPLVANRNLMTAAPEMLCELKGVVHFADGFAYYHDDGPLGRALREWINGARAAIVKAEGRS